MNTTANIIGVYPVDAYKYVHLVEMLVKDSKQQIDLSKFTQEIKDQSKEYWQVPWDERILDETGKEIIANGFLANEEPNFWIGNVRLVFFFHYIEFSKPLITSFGLLDFPKLSERPESLSHIKYESPD